MKDEPICFRWLHPGLNPMLYDKASLVPTEEYAYELRRENQRISNGIQDIQSKIDIMSYHKLELDKRLNEYDTLIPELMEDFKKENTTVDPSKIEKVLKTRDCFCEFYDYRTIANLEGMLVQTKAFLDSFAQFYSIAFNREIRSFSSKGIKLLRDIDNLPQKYSGYGEDLKKHINKAKKKWIDLAIDYRDMVVHFGSLNDLRLFRFQIKSKLLYSPELVKKPLMPNQSTVKNYTNILIKDVVGFCKYGLVICFHRLKDDNKK